MYVSALPLDIFSTSQGYFTLLTMKYRLPQLNGYIQPRKASISNLENLFAALLHIVNLTDPKYKGYLVSYLGQLFNNMSIIYNMDPLVFIAEVKLVRAWFIDYIRGGGLDRGSLTIERWADDQNVPEMLRDIKATMYKCDPTLNFDNMLFFYRILYAMLCADRVISLPPSPNYDSITSDSKVGSSTAGWPDFAEISWALDQIGFKRADFRACYAQYCKEFQYEILSSVGPNGQQTWSAHLDARAWASAPNMFSHLRVFLEESKLVRILHDMIACVRVDSNEIRSVSSPRLGRHAVIPEWGGKTRIVGELDYWSQMALTPLHHTINHFIKKLETDGTFDQDSLARRVCAWTTLKGAEVFSYDLTNATDRIPIAFQRDILCQLLPSHSMASAWVTIMKGRLFIGPDGAERTYAVGQPMGARSSFPMLALCHHVLVMVAAKRAGLKSFNLYAILGDDNTMNSSAVAAQYKALITALGVEISESKSIIHRPTLIPAAEICKRVFVRGEELSMFPTKLLVKASKDGTLGPTLQNTLLATGWNPPADVFWTFMAAILDRDGLGVLIKLNLVPREVSGLIKVIPPATKYTDLNSWFDGITIRPSDLINLQTFVLASDQLKRLDTVLRASSTIVDALGVLAAAHANPKAIPENVKTVWLNSILTDKQRETMNTFLLGIGKMHYNHPILSAARAETNRISALLHSLNSFDANMVTSARNGLLEACRSAIGTMWTWGQSPPIQEQRSIFLRTLTVLNQLIQRGRAKPKASNAWSVTYSVTLASLGRLWNVHFKLGAMTTVNALRAAVSRNVIEASSELSRVLDSVTFDTATKVVEDSKEEGNTPPTESRSENVYLESVRNDVPEATPPLK